MLDYCNISLKKKNGRLFYYYFLLWVTIIMTDCIFCVYVIHLSAKFVLQIINEQKMHFKQITHYVARAQSMQK